jgi:chromosome segregation ATPase
VVEKLKENNRELRAELAALNEQEELLKREQAELKRARHELVTHNAELEQEMNLVEQQIVALQARIVKSPEAIQQGILDVRERIKLEKLRIDDENIKTITVQARIDVLLHVAQELKSYQKLLEPCQAEIANISQVLKDIRRTSDDLSLIKTQVEARKRENASTESQIRQLQDKQLKYRHGHEERLHGIQERIDELKQKHEDGREKNMAVQESMAALNEKIAQADTKLVEVRRTAQNRLKRIKTDFETMELVVSNYEQECRRVLEGGL